MSATFAAAPQPIFSAQDLTKVMFQDEGVTGGSDRQLTRFRRGTGTGVGARA